MVGGLFFEKIYFPEILVDSTATSIYYIQCTLLPPEVNTQHGSCMRLCAELLLLFFLQKKTRGTREQNSIIIAEKTMHLFVCVAILYWCAAHVSIVRGIGAVHCTAMVRSTAA